MGAETFAGTTNGKREARRARVLLAAKLRTPEGERDIRLRDLSCKGALIECREPPTTGSKVTFVRGETVVPSRVAWTAGNRVGLAFVRPIQESEVLVHIARPEHRPPERYRRPRIASEDLSEEERLLVRNWVTSVGIPV